MQANSGEPDQTQHSVASDLGLHCFSMYARHIWFKNAIILLSHESSRNLGSRLFR